MSPAFFPSLHRALDAAAAAGQLAGAACDALADKLSPAVVNDETVFDEAAAEAYLRNDCGLSGSINVEHLHLVSDEFWSEHAEPALTGAELVALRQLIEERFGLPNRSADDDAASEDGVPAEQCPASLTVPPGRDAGHPDIDAFVLAADLCSGANAIRKWANHDPCPEWNRDAWRCIADRLDRHADAFHK